MMRPGAVKFEAKWPPIKETINATLQLKPVKRLDWNDHCSYPHESLGGPRAGGMCGLAWSEGMRPRT